MEFTDPYEIEVPPGTRHLGDAPFWQPGDTVTWTFRRFDFARDCAEVLRPMRVIEDGPKGAVLWLAGGAATTDTRIVGWEDTNPHDVPLQARFLPPAEAPRRIKVDGQWRGAGVLKIVPPRVPFSVWILLKSVPEAAENGGAPELQAEWYVNLEATHRRSADQLFTSDHILDITFPVAIQPLHSADGLLDPLGAVFKDVDELAAAAIYGMWPTEWSQAIRANGMTLLDHLGDFDWAFDPEWEIKARQLALNETRPRPRHRILGGCYNREAY